MSSSEEIKPFSSEMKNYKAYKSEDVEIKKHERKIHFHPYSKQDVEVPEDREEPDNIQSGRRGRGRYYDFEVEKFGNTDVSSIFSFIAIFLVVFTIMFLIRYIELIYGGCPVTLFELLVGRCGKRI